jgi:hypothetical protein
MKAKKYEKAIDFINSLRGKMIHCNDVSIKCDMSKNYASKILDCIFATGGGQYKTIGHNIVYVFDYIVTLEHIAIYLERCRFYSYKSKYGEGR